MKYDSTVFTNSSNGQLEARKALYAAFESYEAPKDEKERSLSLFLRGSQLARIIAINEIYQQIIDIPGNIMDFGTWRGSTAILCENNRAIYEPLNFQRHIYAFDTFDGYKGFAENEAKVSNISNGTYSLENNYKERLEELLIIHEQNNAMGHINKKHHVIKGDVLETLPNILYENKGLTLSLIFIDLNCFKPTHEVINLILPRLLVGGIIAIWQFSRLEIQSESQVFLELIQDKLSYTIYKCKAYPSLVYIKKEK